VGCASGRRGRFKEPIEVMLASADQQWRDRRRIGLDNVDLLLLQADMRKKDDREVLWRLARVEVARGLAAESPREATQHFGRARELGLRCLDRNGGFRQARSKGDWPAALDQLPGVFAPCAGYGAVGWARWLHIIGPDAASGDLEGLELLAKWTRRSSKEEWGGLGSWALGLVAARRPAWEAPTLDRAADHFAAARTSGVRTLWLDADQLRLVATPLADEQAAERLRAQILAATNVTPEDRSAQRLVEATTPSAD
jgi:hypothetical protein